MCTVKKDIENIPESPFLSDSSSRSSCDYDLANRKQSQMLLDMIYKNSAGSGASVVCPSGLAEFSTSGCCMKNPYEAPDLYHRNSDRAIWDELKRLRSSITEVQTTLQKLPQQIVAAFLESEPCFGIRAQLDELSDEDDFDHLTETTNTATTTPSSSLGTKRCLSTCSSSDIEVLSRCSPIKCSSEMINSCKSSSSASQIVDISKEIAQLAKSINLISLPAKMHRTASSVPGDEQAAKRFVSDLFAHWEQSYQSSNDLMMDNKSGKAPTGNIRSPSEVMSFEITPPPKINSCAAEEKINILPYNSNIDLNVWLK